MMNLNDIQEFINNAPGNIVGTLDRPEAVPDDILDKIPHRYSSDLIVQYWLQMETEDIFMRLLIDNDLAKYLGYTEEYLYYHACKNIGAPIVENLLDKMGHMMVSDIDTEAVNKILYLLTNSSMRFGSFYLCMPDVLGEIADKYSSDLVIIPSSKHELLFLKRDDVGLPLCCIKDMVHMVNQTELKPKDILSDSVYIYDREERKVIVY